MWFDWVALPLVIIFHSLRTLSNRDCDRGVLPAFISSFAPYPVWTSSNSSTNHDILEFSNYIFHWSHSFKRCADAIPIKRLWNSSCCASKYVEPYETIILTKGLENHVKCVIRTPTNWGTERATRLFNMHPAFWIPDQVPT